jgi:hypothetical protein
MPRESYVYDKATGQLVERNAYYASRPRPARSELSSPMVITDSIEIKSMTDGRIYTSKRGLRAAYRQQGYIEVGDAYDKHLPEPPKSKANDKERRLDIAKAFSEAGVSL